LTQLLAIDTSSAWCSVALSLNDAVPLVRSQKVSAGASQLLLPWIKELLDEASIQMGDLDAIAVDVGPGAFTGVRLGVAATQGLAIATKLPVLPVASLDAMAAQLVLKPTFIHSNSQAFLIAVDARMGEVYWAHYQVHEKQVPIRLGDIHLSSPELVQIAGAQYVAGSAIKEFGDRLIASAPTQIPLTHQDPELAGDATGVLLCAKKMWDQGLQQDIHLLEPLYVRNKVAFTSAERSQQNG
jgi:tRNA threonylcarbamoyladenosine biosynthesis protein TsaB